MRRFLKEKMELYINSSKTDQYRQGASILIARTGLTTCPVGMVERYVAAGNVDLGSEERLFRAICVTKNGESLRVSGSLSYTRMREIVLAKLRELGYDAKKFGLHSFRAGGGGHRRQQTPQAYWRGTSRGMGGGSPSQPRTDMSRIQRRVGLRCHRVWEFDGPLLVLIYLAIFVTAIVVCSITCTAVLEPETSV